MCTGGGSTVATDNRAVMLRAEKGRVKTDAETQPADRETKRRAAGALVGVPANSSSALREQARQSTVLGGAGYGR